MRHGNTIRKSKYISWRITYKSWHITSNLLCMLYASTACSLHWLVPTVHHWCYGSATNSSKQTLDPGISWLAPASRQLSQGCPLSPIHACKVAVGTHSRCFGSYQVLSISPEGVCKLFAAASAAAFSWGCHTPCRIPITGHSGAPWGMPPQWESWDRPILVIRGNRWGIPGWSVWDWVEQVVGLIW